MAKCKASLSCIYQIRNVINCKIYIGYTSDHINRKSSHFSLLRKGSHANDRLQKSVSKYGMNAFIFEIIEQCPIDDLPRREHYWTTILRSHNPEYGYNIALVDKDSPWSLGSNPGWKHTIEAIKKITDRSQQEDNKKRIRNIQKLAVEVNTGSKRTLEQRLNIKRGLPGPYKIIQVFDITNTLLFECNLIQEASMKTNVKPSNLRNNLCGLSKRAGLFIFKWKEVYHR